MERIGHIKALEKSGNENDVMLAVLGGAAEVYSKETTGRKNMQVTIKGYAILGDSAYKGIDVDTGCLEVGEKLADIRENSGSVPIEMLKVMAGASSFLGSNVMIVDDKIFYIKDNEIYSAKVDENGSRKTFT